MIATTKRAFWLSAMALLVPIVAAQVGPRAALDDLGFLTWVLALVPAFLLAYYRGWVGSTLALALGMIGITMSHVVITARGGVEPSVAVIAPLLLSFIVVTVGVGVLTEAIRSGSTGLAGLTDPETGLPNDIHLGIALDTTLAAAAANGERVACLLADIPGLPALPGGRRGAARREVLQTLVTVMNAHLPERAIHGRWEQDSFLVILTGMHSGDARQVADRLTDAFQQSAMRWRPLSLRTRTATTSTPGAGRQQILRRLQGEPVEPPEGGRSTQELAPLEEPVPASDWRAKALNQTVLIIDDEELNRRVLDRTLSEIGFTSVETASGGQEAIERLRSDPPDLLILDLHMPGVNGFEVLNAARTSTDPDEFLPILVVTGDQDRQQRQRALQMGAKDFLTKPFDVSELGARALNLLETRLLHQTLRRTNLRLEKRVRSRTRELQRAQEEVLHRLAQAVEFRDDVTGRHAQRVGDASASIAASAGLDPEDQELLRQAAPLHDIGKIAIPDSVLLKAGPLTEEEKQVMRSHTTIGAELLANSTSRAMGVARKIALSHHERWDGAGYPNGLAGEAIPLAGRIVAVADALDALVHERPYKSPVSFDQAVARLREGAGSHFDPTLVAAIDAALPELRALMLGTELTAVEVE